MKNRSTFGLVLAVLWLALFLLTLDYSSQKIQMGLLSVFLFLPGFVSTAALYGHKLIGTDSVQAMKGPGEFYIAFCAVAGVIVVYYAGKIVDVLIRIPAGMPVKSDVRAVLRFSKKLNHKPFILFYVAVTLVGVLAIEFLPAYKAFVIFAAIVASLPVSAFSVMPGLFDIPDSVMFVIIQLFSFMQWYYIGAKLKWKLEQPENVAEKVPPDSRL
ncbi:MAG: hypothetical protein WC889_11885 [Myxococcota bacterium]|jgi:hypothetical protein